LPTFQFSKALSLTRGVRAFLSLEGRVTCGSLEDVEQYKERAENLKNAQQHILKQKKTLKSQRLEIFRLREELRAAKEWAEGTLDNRPAPQAAGEPQVGGLPDFVIIGAHKCGTTSLYHSLTRHPHVEGAATKELEFFNRHFDKGIEWYRRCFPRPRWKDGRRSITGEATPYYLFHPHAAKRMAEVVPRARMIVLLRNPVDRAYSHYHHRTRLGRETRSFEEAIEAETTRLLRKVGKTAQHENRARGDNERSKYLSKGASMWISSCAGRSFSTANRCSC
jgi:hypothetical protein